MDIRSPVYKRAFDAYLRKGMPIELTLKSEQPTTHYIWRTRQDGKVRPSHAVNDGKIFSWDEPPETGHPGEEYGCRCYAEAYLPIIREYIDITLSGVSDTGTPWSTLDFLSHYFRGGGRDVTVRETGHLSEIVNEYKRIALDDPERLPGQIADFVRENKGGSFSDHFGRPYRMTGVAFSIGNTVIGGVYSGTASEKHGIVKIRGNIDFYLEDEFKDALDVFNRFEFLDFDVPGSQSYRIHDKWSGRFVGEFYLSREGSIYKSED